MAEYHKDSKETKRERSKKKKKKMPEKEKENGNNAKKESVIIWRSKIIASLGPFD